MLPTVDKQLSPDAASVQQARQSVTDLGELLSKKEAQDLSLLVSELVTNSILYGGLLSEDLIGLKIYFSMTLIRTEVRNAGSGFELDVGGLIGGGPSENAPRLTQTSGWGLQLVARLADRWGAESEEPDKAEASEQMTLVWFEIDRASNDSECDDTSGGEKQG